MALKTQITGSSYPTSGAATAGTTGFNAISGFTHVGAPASALPIGSSSTGYLKSTAGSPASFKIDATAAGTPGGKYSVSFNLRVVPINPTFPGMTNGQFAFIMPLTSGSADARFQTVFYKSTVDVQKQSAIQAKAVAFTGGSVANIVADNAQTLPFNRWVVASFVFTPGASASMEFVVNGQTLSRGTLDASTMTTGALDNWTFTLPSWADIEFHIAPTITTWNATGLPYLTQGPRTGSNLFSSPTTYDMAWFYNAVFVDGAEGANWRLVGGTLPTPVRTLFATGGTNPQATRQVHTATAGAQDKTYRTNRNIEALQFNAEGWFSIYFPHTYLSGAGSSAEFALRNTGDSFDYFRLKVVADGAVTWYDANIGTTVPLPLKWFSGARYAVELLLNSDGRAMVALHRLTDNVPTGAYYGATTMLQAVAVRAPWAAVTGSTFGPLEQKLISANNGDVLDIAGVGGWRYACKTGIDSYSQATVFGLTPSMTCDRNRVSFFIPAWFDAGSASIVNTYVLPDGTSYTSQTSDGWSGNTFQTFKQTNGKAVIDMPGQRVLIFMGFTNDCFNVASQGAGDALAEILSTRFVDFVVQACAAESRVDWITPANQVLGPPAAPGAFANYTIARTLALVMSKIRRYDTKGRFRVFNPLVNFVGSDGMHPDDANCVTLWQNLATAGMTVVPFSAQRGYY